ncbi:Subtilisin-like protease SBT1.2 [Striga hermonthica]|uniref:Subtilisin-like protease SBT1.2 n=1 Tax=Striga hermonthica TaxID=68872 RepID=A0A9N7P337_STRHE|nr:Subtilisin-like protease SBT1.2 [Striga hermonthica]
MAPQAHLAIYRVCISRFCRESNIMVGLDAAIKDGVDILSISLGSSSGGSPFYDDAIAVGTFAADAKGILVSFAAGNSEPLASTMDNDAPWSLTVGASKIDRRFPATAKLGNGVELDEESVYPPTNFSSMNLLPLVYCPGSLVGFDVSGKIVLLDAAKMEYQVEDVKNAGGVAMILVNTKSVEFTHESNLISLPSTSVSFSTVQKIKDYIKSTSSPKATIVFQGTQFGDPTALAISYFSSRGPSKRVSGVLKPDILGWAITS